MDDSTVLTIGVCEAITQTVAQAIERANTALDLEQAPAGVDTWAEAAFQALVASTLTHALPTHTIIREQPFPGKPLSGPKITDRERCDIVILPAGYHCIADLEVARRERAALKSTLFAESSLADNQRKGHAGPEACFWLEIKLARAWITGDRGVRPNPSYTRELTDLPILDVGKLAADPLIAHSAACIIAFGPDQSTLRHDLNVAIGRALDRGAPIRSPIVRGCTITDRIGNAQCAVSLWPIRR